jgi:hypothetical protein
MSSSFLLPIVRPYKHRLFHTGVSERFTKSLPNLITPTFVITLPSASVQLAGIPRSFSHSSVECITFWLENLPASLKLEVPGDTL